MPTVAEVMTRTIPRVAADTALSGSEPRVALVVDPQGRTLGMLIDGVDARTHGARTAADAMTVLFWAARPDWPVTRAAALMATEGVEGVPVRGAGGEVVGWISGSAIVRSLAERDAWPGQRSNSIRT